MEKELAWCGHRRHPLSSRRGPASLRPTAAFPAAVSGQTCSQATAPTESGRMRSRSTSVKNAAPNGASATCARTASQSICSRSDRAISRTGRKSGILLAHREQLRGEHVVERGHEQRLGRHLERGGPLEVRVADRPAGRVEDQVDEDVAVPGLQQPSLRRPLGPHARGLERFQRPLGVAFAEEEVDVVVGRWPAARPGREPAAEEERDIRLREAHPQPSSWSRAARESRRSAYSPWRLVPRPPVRRITERVGPVRWKA